MRLGHMLLHAFVCDCGRLASVSSWEIGQCMLLGEWLVYAFGRTVGVSFWRVDLCVSMGG